jgi:hypothetical protein
MAEESGMQSAPQHIENAYFYAEGARPRVPALLMRPPRASPAGEGGRPDCCNQWVPQALTIVIAWSHGNYR